MIINTSYSQNYLYKKPSTSSFPAFQKTADSVTFKGLSQALKRETSLSAESVSGAYKSIMEILLTKTDKGIENIEKEFPDFTFGRGLMFHNCGEKKTSIAVRIPDGKTGRDFLKIVVKQGNTFFKQKNILESFTLNGYNKLVEDTNPNSVFVFPKEIKPAGFDSEKESTFQTVLDDLDFAMLKFRRYLEKVRDLDLKPVDAVLPLSGTETLASIEKFCGQTCEMLKNLPHKVSLNIKSEFADYKKQTGKVDFILQNIGQEKLQMSYKKLQDDESGKLSRLMVYDKNGEICDGFLIKDDKMLVANFNHKNFAIIPPKLTFYDEGSIKKVLPTFTEYLDSYNKKLSEFNDFVSQKISQRGLTNCVETNPQIENFSDEISSIYDAINESFKSFGASKVSNLKTSYSLWNRDFRQKGFSFVTKDDEAVSILKMKGGEFDNLLRICVTKNGEDNYFLVNNGMVVKNFNPKYPSILPPALKYFDKTEVENMGVIPVLENTLRSIKDFKTYVDAPKFPRKPLSTTNEKPVKEKLVKEKPQKPVQLSQTPEYKDLMKECKTDFKTAMLNAENNLENFNKTILEIQKKINDFFTKNNA